MSSAEATTGGHVVALANQMNVTFVVKNVTNVSDVATLVLSVMNVGRGNVQIVGIVLILIVENVIAFALIVGV